MRSLFGEREKCDRFLARGRSAIAFWREGEVRSGLRRMRGCDRVLAFRASTVFDDSAGYSVLNGDGGGGT